MQRLDRFPLVAAFVSLPLIGCCFASNQETASLSKGEIVAKVVCSSDTSQSHALYLPRNYTPERCWPILYAFDPGARGNVPVERFREAAEKYGYIVAGSNNLRNGPWEPTVVAFRAMWDDSHQRFPLDAKRVYMAGFSGGARVACTFARLLEGSVAGVIASGAGFPVGPGQEPSRDTPFIFFGTAGIRDFNLPELRGLDKTLDNLGVVHRIEVFSGGHDWAPENLSTAALEWMEIHAMKGGRREKDKALIDALFENHMKETRDAEESGDLARAFHRWRSIVADFDGLRDVSEVGSKLRQLEGSKELKNALRQEEKREKRIEALVSEYWRALNDVLGAIQTGQGGPMEIQQAVRELQLPYRRKQAQENKETEEGIAAGRFVVGLLVQSRERAMDAFAARDYARAKLNMQIAAECAPNNPFILYTLARACALNKDRKGPLSALRRSVENGFRDADQIEKNPEFDSLHDLPRCVELISQLQRKRSSPPPSS